MTLGISATHTNSILNVFRGVAYSGITVYVKLHTGDPGAAGTANASAVTTRNAATFVAPSGGSMSLSSISGFSMTATETVSHLSLWDSLSGGTFLQSVALTTPRSVLSGDVINLATLTLSGTPLAA